MRRLLALLALPVLAVALSAQARPKPAELVGDYFSPSRTALVGGHLAAATMSTVALIDLSTGSTVARLRQAGYVVAVEASPVEDVIAVGNCGRSVELWNVKTRRRLHRLAIRRECVNSVSFSPDGALLAIADVGCCAGGECGPDGGSVQIWDVRSGTLKKELAKDVDISRVAFSRDGRWLAAADDKGKTTTVFEWPSGRPLRRFGGPGNAGAPESSGLSSPDGKYLAWQAFHELQVWNVASGTRVALPASRPEAWDEDEEDERQPGNTQPAWTEQPVRSSAAEFLSDGRLAYVDGHHLRIVTLPSGPMEERPLEPPRTVWFGDIGSTHAPEWRRIHRNGRTIVGTYESRLVLWDIGTATLRDLTSTRGKRRER